MILSGMVKILGLGGVSSDLPGISNRLGAGSRNLLDTMLVESYTGLLILEKKWIY